MLKDYRGWLQSERDLLANASHHAYAFGQANMAERAIARFDEEVNGTAFLPLDPHLITRVLMALELLSERETHLDPALAELRETFKTVMSEQPQPE